MRYRALAIKQQDGDVSYALQELHSRLIAVSTITNTYSGIKPAILTVQYLNFATLN